MFWKVFRSSASTFDGVAKAITYVRAYAGMRAGRRSRAVLSEHRGKTRGYASDTGKDG